MGSARERREIIPEVESSEQQRKKAIIAIQKTIDLSTIKMNMVKNRPHLSIGVVWADGLPFCFSAYNKSNTRPLSDTEWDIYVPKPAHEFGSPIPGEVGVSEDQKRKILEKFGVTDVADVHQTFQQTLAERRSLYDEFMNKYHTDVAIHDTFTEAIKRALAEKEEKIREGKLK